MSHARYQLLAAVKALLAGAATPPWRSVHVADDVPPKASLPCVVVDAPAESANDAGLVGRRRQERTAQVDVKCYMSALANPIDNTAKLHTLASAVETVITQAALAGTAEDVYLLGLDTESLPDERGFISITLHYAASYSTLEGRPDTLGAD